MKKATAVGMGRVVRVVVRVVSRARAWAGRVERADIVSIEVGGSVVLRRES